MPRLLCSLIISAFLLLSPQFCQAGPAPQTEAAAAILIDSHTGTVLFEKNARQTLAPASTTKIMTAILAIESGKLDRKTIISDNAANTPGSSLELKAGQTFVMRQLLTGMLLRSGNDCAVAIAEFLAGSADSFVSQMNDKAIKLGAFNTQFKNPNGLPAEGHFSTAYDLAMITRYAMTLPEFAQIVNTRHTRISFEDTIGSQQDQPLKNTNKLLWMLEEADGVKTGTTNEAGPCLVSSATRNGQQLIAVTLHDAKRWQDSRALLEWGFANYRLYDYAAANDYLTTVPVQNGFAKSVDLMTGEAAQLTVRSTDYDAVKVILDTPDKIKAPVYQGQKIGTLTFLVNDEAVKTVDLIAQSAVEEKSITRLILNQLTMLFRFFSDLGII